MNKTLIAAANAEDRKPDADLQSAFEYNPLEDFDIEDIESMEAAVYGAADGASWYWLVSVKPDTLAAQAGPYALLTGGCDYTGWDCQSHLDLIKQGSRTEVLESAPIEDAYGRRVQETLRKQLDNDLPYGVI